MWNMLRTRREHVPASSFIEEVAGVVDQVGVEYSAGGDKENEENRGEPRRELLKLKNAAMSESDRQNEGDESDRVDRVCHRLIVREEALFSQNSTSEDENRLHKDLEVLNLQIRTTVQNTFSCSSSGQLDELRSAVACIQQQEAQDRRWTDPPADRLPPWRPLNWLSAHNTLLRSVVESRLTEAAEDDSGGAEGFSSPLKTEVCHLGRRVQGDLLTVARTVTACYPPEMDVLNVYAGLYHQSFSARLTELVASGPEINNCSYLLLWVNHFYPQTVLKHEDLDGKLKTELLSSLLLQDVLTQLEDRYLTHQGDKVQLWLSRALKREEELWLSGTDPELIDSWCYSPLAADVIQMTDLGLTESGHVFREQSRAERINAQLESFLSSYKKSLEKFVKRNQMNVRSVVKAQLVCEQQLRDYVTGPTGSLTEQQRQRCLDTLTELRDCGYRYFTCPLHLQLKVCFRHLWTSVWLDGSLPVVDSLLDSLIGQLIDLKDLREACRQSLLCVILQDVVLQYVKRMMKTRMKGREQQVGGAQRMKEDAQKINAFFTEGGCSESLWFSEVLCSLAEVLHLQDPGSVQLELVSLARAFPDLSDGHVSALLSLRTDLSAADSRSIRRSVKENRLLEVSASHRPPFFSRVKVHWIHTKINQMRL